MFSFRRLGGKRSTAARRSCFRPWLEALEDRRLLAYSPAQVTHGYGFDLISFNKPGVGQVKGDGAGQTIAIVDAYNNPNLASNLATFDSQYGLAAPPSFQIVNQTGGSTLPAGDTGWGLEEALDVQWAHAIAPGANILLVEANSAFDSDLLAAVDYARKQAGVVAVSMSWGGGEFSGEASDDGYFTTPSGHGGVTFLASSGDGGAPPSWPAISTHVVAVGGTTLNLDGSGNYQGETGWSGSGGGPSAFLAKPSYQQGKVTLTNNRANPDIAYDADPNTGFPVYDTYGYGGFLQVGGTSAGSPQWAALIAIADQGRGYAGLGALDGLADTLPKLYQLASGDYHDITSGNNGYPAGAGYDFVTGLGSPLAQLVVNDLVGAPPQPPPAPANLTATAGNGQVALSWAPVSGATTYNLYRATTSNGEGSTPYQTGLSSTAYTDVGLTNGTTYYYQVTAVGAGGESAKSTEASATPTAGSPPFTAHINFSNNTTQVPAGYVNDIGKAYQTQGSLTFGWNVDNTVNARDRDASNSPDERYDSLNHMQKAGNPNAYWEIAVPNGTYTVHVVEGDPVNTDSVYAVNAEGVLALSGTPTPSAHWVEGTVTVTVSDGRLTITSAAGAVNNKIDYIDVMAAPTTPPAAPANLTATAGQLQITLNWSPSSGATGYNLYRGTAAGQESLYQTGLTTASYTDSAVTAGTTYWYYATATNGSGESGPSNEVSAVPTAPPAFVAHINFSNNATEVPAGYVNDIGKAYQVQGNLTFGWNVDNTVNARDRQASNSPDERYDSLNHMQKSNNPNAYWEIAVPNGKYTVHVVEGDPVNTDSVYAVNAEGVLALSGTPTPSAHWVEGTVTVSVTDGRLTITSAAGSSNNKIDYIDVTYIGPNARLPRHSFLTVLSAEASEVVRPLAAATFAITPAAARTPLGAAAATSVADVVFALGLTRPADRSPSAIDRPATPALAQRLADAVALTVLRDRTLELSGGGGEEADTSDDWLDLLADDASWRQAP